MQRPNKKLIPEKRETSKVVKQFKVQSWGKCPSKWNIPNSGTAKLGFYAGLCQYHCLPADYTILPRDFGSSSASETHLVM
jgi:hypothetical protein